MGPRTFYWLFLLLAAPIEMILDWVQGYRGSDPELFSRPTAEGLLYIYAFIASAETLFRLSHNEKIVKSKPHLKINIILCWLIFAAFLFFYVASDRSLVLNHKPIELFGQRLESFLAVIAIMVSYTTFHQTHPRH